MKKFSKSKKKTETAQDTDPVLKRQRFLQARALRKRRQRKSNQ